MRKAVLLLGAAVGLAVSCGGTPNTADEPSSGSAGRAGSTTPGGQGGALAGAGVGAGTAGGGRSNTGGSLIGFGGFVGDGGAEDPGACATGTAEADFVPANFLFVLDTSGSMNCNPPNGDAVLAARCERFPRKEDKNLPSKWEVTKSALHVALAGLADKPHVNVGLMLFPRASACGVSAEPSVPLAPLDEAQRQAIDTALAGIKPVGETPVAGATILSYGHIAKQLRAGMLSGNSFVVLLTDGAETCAPAAIDPLLDQHVQNARLFGIRTFVIGAPGSEVASPLLSTLAWEGGTATDPECEHDRTAATGTCHFDMTASADFEGELVRALETIASSEELSCEIGVPENADGGGVDLDRVNVTFTPAGKKAISISNDDAPCAEANGWQYSADRSKIVLCGDACLDVRKEPGELSIVLGCPTIRIR